MAPQAAPLRWAAWGHQQLLVCGLLLASRIAACCALTNAKIDDQSLYVAPGTSAAELIEARGYLARQLQFVTTDNYTLEITRATNPLLEGRPTGKLPILFLHASIATGANFLTNSAFARPRLYNSSASPAELTTGQLYQLVREDPARRSLPLLAMNFGHPVYILSRRGFTAGSRHKLGRRRRTVRDAIRDAPVSLTATSYSLPLGLEGRPQPVPLSQVAYSQITSANVSQPIESSSPSLLSLVAPINLVDTIASISRLPNELAQLGNLSQEYVDTFDPDFWDFGLDQQAQYDLPAAIEFVLADAAASKLHLLAHSGGARVTLLGLSHEPDLADKVASTVLWSPATVLPNPLEIDLVLTVLGVPPTGFQGPAPFVERVNLLRTALQQLCGSNLTQTTLCEIIVDSLYGPSGGQQPIRQSFLADLLAPTAMGELVQLAQFAFSRHFCMFKFRTAAENVARYGQKQPPCYDLARIRASDISMYTGREDAMSGPEETARVVSQMRVPVQLNVIGDSKLRFNHQGHALHNNADELIILPSLIDIDRSDARQRSASAAAGN